MERDKIMLSLLLALVVAPSVAVGQQPSLTADDVHAIEALVVEYLVPANGNLGARPTKGRLLLIDPDQVPGFTISRAFRAATHDAAVQCADPAHGVCQVANDGIWLTISDAAFVPATGELRVHAGAIWTHAFPGHYNLVGFDLDLFYARTNSGWQLVRVGTARVG
jgi:hypothetical protein